MKDALIALDSGSSSLKFALFALGPGASLELIYRGEIEGIGTEPRFRARAADGREIVNRGLRDSATELFTHDHALTLLLAWPREHSGEYQVIAAGHRVVHGGDEFFAPARIDESVIERLERLIPLAPLHQSNNLNLIKALKRVAPDLPQIACFDTAFHCTLPRLARLFPLPRALTESGIRRYGFHGLSYEYIAEALPGYLGHKADGRVVVAHLGNGASLCALKGRKSIASTMGFTALDGLMMGTRCGAIDPGVLLYLMNERGMNVAGLTELLYRRSGLLGVSGIAADMRTLLASPHPHAQEAVDLFVYRIVRELGSLAAALEGLDALVFTGGIGEHAAPVREKVCLAAAWLGLELDPAANEVHGPRISRETSPVSAWVIPTNEELMIARHTLRLL